MNSFNQCLVEVVAEQTEVEVGQHVELGHGGNSDLDHWRDRPVADPGSF